MNIAKEVFYGMNEVDNIQLDFLKEAIRKNEDKCIINLKEIEEVIDMVSNDELDYSNETSIDMIIKGIVNNTSNNELKELLENTFVVVGTVKKDVMARAYPRYEDNSYLVELGRDICLDMNNMADILACIILIREYKNKHMEILHLLLEYNLKKLGQDNDQINQQIDALVYNYGDDEFLELYVKVSREIIEVANAFLVGHEIGHHYYGHTTNRYNELVSFNDLESEIESADDPRLNELLADKFAVTFVYEFLIAYDSSINVQQGCGYFIPFLVTALNGSVLKGGETHPSLWIRILLVKDHLTKVFEANSNEIINLIIGELCNVLNLIGKDFNWWNKEYKIKKGVVKGEI